MLEDPEIQVRKMKQDKIQEEQRKFRNLQSDQKYYTDEVVILIRKQKGTIEKLQKENDTLKDLVTKLHQKRGQSGGFSRTQNITKIQQLKDLIKEEKQSQQQTKTHINNFQKKIVEKKNNFGGYNSSSQNESQLQKQIKILENRLDKANQKFNEAIAFNKDLKQDIEGLRRERKIFDTLYQKLQKQLQQKRKSMANIIEKANNAYQERDKANLSIQGLKQQSKKQTVDFEKQLKQLSHVMLKTKLANTVISYPKPKDDSFKDYHEDMKASKNIKQMRDKVNTNQLQKLQKYRQDFAKIEAATQIQNFKDLIRIFSQNQEKNFKMFKFVNQQSNEIQQLKQSVSQLKQELSQYQATVSNPAEIKEKYIESLQSKLESQKTRLSQEQQKHRKTSRTLKNLTTHIQTIFNTLECDRQVAKEVAGSKMVSEGNMTVFLAIIQEKVMRLIKMYKEKTSLEESTYEQIVVNHDKTLKSPEPLIFDDYEDEDEEFDKLMTHQDFIKKANEKIYEQNQKMRHKSNRPKKKHAFDYKLS